ncbi:B box and SPRY domain-containing protein [Callorhinchus milii]|uniref:B box and SPRY domain-containing protein n=1 Tax=Callorhinchus milii TaxID=7868 RepID=UPI001C3FDFC0|nr:B box and SPRY domain-containing protein [Callorhinchus milii]
MNFVLQNKLVDICEKLQLRLASVERFVEERLSGKNHSVKGEASVARELIIQRLNHVREACESEEQRLLEVVHAEEERAQQSILTQKSYWSESQDKLLGIKAYLVDTLTKMDDATLLKLQSDVFERAEEAEGILEPQDSDKLNFNPMCARSHLLDSLWASIAMICTAGVKNLHIDERTINQSLILSDNKKVLAFVTKKVQRYPDCPERFDYWPNALALESFQSGIHTWKVDVGKSCAYKVGVAQNSLSRKSPGPESRLGYNAFSWVFSRYDEEYTVTHHGKPQALDLLKRPTQIGVLVDFEGGEVLFYDPNSCVLIHSFRAKFTDPVYAAFAVADQSIAIIQ